ncbi:MAG: DUF4198 domain-containing protein [Candidatus Kryptonium sp.]|nr:DUF4198 domain-containing protein [Candidatus Kryptonium sp.]MCX7762615.1 DUF4198 domain-containing protein [Candidatus Kryptonium sp.]MDW8109644.1 DUF4198 domain-containing protein [Candidatus Kryptonium sp.]
MKNFLIFLLVFNIAFAHDYWLKPKKFILSKDDTLTVHLYVGDKLNIEFEREFQSEMTEKFAIITNDTIINLLPNLNDKAVPVLNKKFDLSGLALIAMDRGWAYIDLSRKDFEEYLEHEGIDDIKLSSTDTSKVERERYRRYIKSLISFDGKVEGEVYKKVINQRLEIILLKNPFLLKVGDVIEAKVLFEGKPLVNKTVMLYSLERNKVSEQKVKTDKNGIARFRIKNPGFHLVRLVYLRKCEGCDNLDWESFWASFSFEIRRSK